MFVFCSFWAFSGGGAGEVEGRGEGDKWEDFRASVTKVGLYSALKMERERGFDSFRLEVSVGSAREGRERASRVGVIAE